LVVVEGDLRGGAIEAAATVNPVQYWDWDWDWDWDWGRPLLGHLHAEHAGERDQRENEDGGNVHVGPLNRSRRATSWRSRAEAVENLPTA
jgi:hypothetical protein